MCPGDKEGGPSTGSQSAVLLFFIRLVLAITKDVVEEMGSVTKALSVLQK